MNPLVSILIPLYNSEKYISETIESCLYQTYTNIEIIIVNDGSTDNSYRIAKLYESDNVKVYQQKNSGACRARNYAFELCSGDYIQYLDADDLLNQYKIENQIKVFKKFGNDILVSCAFKRFNSDISEFSFSPLSIYKNYDDPLELLCDMWTNKEMMANSGWMVHRQYVGKVGTWNESLSKNQDGDFFCRIILSVKSVIFCPEALVYYRITGKKSISENKNYQACLSTLNSFHWYEKYIENAFGTIQNKKMIKALACNYSNFYFYFYPNFPELLHQAELYTQSLGFKSFVVPSTMQYYYHLLSKIIGFKNTVKIIRFVKGKLNNIKAF